MDQAPWFRFPPQLSPFPFPPPRIPPGPTTRPPGWHPAPAPGKSPPHNARIPPRRPGHLPPQPVNRPPRTTPPAPGVGPIDSQWPARVLRAAVPSQRVVMAHGGRLERRGGHQSVCAPSLLTLERRGRRARSGSSLQGPDPAGLPAALTGHGRSWTWVGRPRCGPRMRAPAHIGGPRRLGCSPPAARAGPRPYPPKRDCFQSLSDRGCAFDGTATVAGPLATRSRSPGFMLDSSTCGLASVTGRRGRMTIRADARAGRLTLTADEAVPATA